MLYALDSLIPLLPAVSLATERSASEAYSTRAFPPQEDLHGSQERD